MTLVPRLVGQTPHPGLWELPIEERFYPDGYQNPGIGRSFDRLGWRGSVISSGEVLSRDQCVITLWVSD